MAQAFSVHAAVVPRTGILVLNSGPQPVLCPFFGRCDGLLVVERTDRTGKFYAVDHPNRQFLCDLILELQPQRLICGFIPPADKAALRNAGIDVRLGSCTASVDELVSCFCDLPEA